MIVNKKAKALKEKSPEDILSLSKPQSSDDGDLDE
jgi:hypothetical protein